MLQEEKIWLETHFSVLHLSLSTNMVQTRAGETLTLAQGTKVTRADRNEVEKQKKQ